MTPGNITLKRADESQKPIIRNLLQLHLHDLSDIAGGIEVNHLGVFPYDNFDLYWIDDRAEPCLIFTEQHIAGFALVYRHATNRLSIVEFFILKKYRRKGISTFAANQLIQSVQGECEISYSAENEPAVRFWTRIAQSYAHTLQEIRHENWQGNILRISTGAPDENAP